MQIIPDNKCPVKINEKVHLAAIGLGIVKDIDLLENNFSVEFENQLYKYGFDCKPLNANFGKRLDKLVEGLPLPKQTGISKAIREKNNYFKEKRCT